MIRSQDTKIIRDGYNQAMILNRKFLFRLFYNFRGRDSNIFGINNFRRLLTEDNQARECGKKHDVS